MDNHGGAMQRRMDSHGMPAHPPLHSSTGKYEVAVTHSFHSLYDYRMPTKNNNSKEKGAGAESSDSTLAEGRAALDEATRIIL